MSLNCLPHVHIPIDIGKRSLPPLPIAKRKLPSLPASKSYFKPQSAIATSTTTVASADDHEIKSNAYANVQKRFHTTNRSLRNLFGNIHKKTMSKFGNKNNNNNNNNNGITQSPSPPPPPVFIKERSLWHPTLDVIFKDNELLPALISFMKTQYNEENILFLQKVYKIYDDINDINTDINTNDNAINISIVSVYNEYIVHNAPSQINLSYECYLDIMQSRTTFNSYNLHQKQQLFTTCIYEIERLIITGVLNNFYSSDEFQDIAQERDIRAMQIGATILSPTSSLNLNYNLNLSSARSSVTQSHVNQSYSMGTDVTNSTWCSSIDLSNLNINCNQSNTSLFSDYINKIKMEFDIHSSQLFFQSNKYMICSSPFEFGYHEWTIQILQCKDQRQEFGIVSNFDININVNEYGILDTPQFGARVVYGYNKYSDHKYNKLKHIFYYASYNKNNSVRCNKDLTNLDIHQRGLFPGDTIKICLNLKKGNIKFYLNSKKVRKTISVEKNVKYYPIILYSGHCQYKID